jgi:hypothetical protein
MSPAPHRYPPHDSPLYQSRPHRTRAMLWMSMGEELRVWHGIGLCYQSVHFQDGLYGERVRAREEARENDVLTEIPLEPP